MIKKILILLAFTINATSQTCVSNSMPIESIKDNKTIQVLGTCLTPDGPNQIISAPPPSYAWLNANGYCIPFAPATRTFNECYTFTSTATTATLNAGYSSTGCAVITFGGFNLYTCAPSCTLVGTGLTFAGLTIGQCYTWCFSGNCIGGPGPGFTTLCPYYMQPVALPVEISYFTVTQQYKQNVIEWHTQTEHNSSYFEVERANNSGNFSSIGAITAAFNSTTIKKYHFIDKEPKNDLNYYRLKQIDNNGTIHTNAVIIVVDNRADQMKPYKIYNTSGQEVDETYEGLKIIQYLDGKIIKTY